MAAQAEFFAACPESELVAVSDNNRQAFNEFLHLGVEQGIVGLAILAALLWLCRRSMFFPLVVGWCAFGMFSYPADVLPLQCISVVAVALCSSGGRRPTAVADGRWAILAVVLAVPPAVVTDIRYSRAMERVPRAETAEFPSNETYMSYYARSHPTVENLERLCRDHCSSSEILCDLGDCYLECGDIVRADSCYTLAHRMVPRRVVPLHRLMLLYRDRNDSLAMHYSELILRLEPSHVGSAVLRARADVFDYLNNRR